MLVNRVTGADQAEPSAALARAYMTLSQSGAAKYTTAGMLDTSNMLVYKPPEAETVTGAAHDEPAAVVAVTNVTLDVSANAIAGVPPTSVASMTVPDTPVLATVIGTSQDEPLDVNARTNTAAPSESLQNAVAGMPPANSPDVYAPAYCVDEIVVVIVLACVMTPQSSNAAAANIMRMKPSRQT